MTEALVKKIHWLGHDAFRIDGSKTVYIDPYQIKGGPTADLILVSHEHFDHCSPEDVAKIQGPKTIVVTEKDSAKKLDRRCSGRKARGNLEDRGDYGTGRTVLQYGQGLSPQEEQLAGLCGRDGRRAHLPRRG